MVRQLVHDSGITILDFQIRDMGSDNINNALNARVYCHDIIKVAVVQALLKYQFKRPNRISQFQVRTILVKSSSPHSNWLAHHRLPAKFINCGMETHTNGCPENRSEAADDKTQTFSFAQRLQ